MSLDSYLINKQGEFDKWDMIEVIERDISFLYYQLSSYSYVMGDLRYNTYYKLPYWDYLDTSDLRYSIDDDRIDFIREGCLIIILAMTWDIIDGSGFFIQDKLDVIKNRLKKFEPQNENQAKLHNIVVETVNFALYPDKEMYSDIKIKSIWVHKEFVRGYYRKMINEFDTNPYYNK